MVSRYMKRCSILLIIREVRIETTVTYHLMLVRMAIIKMTANNKCWKVLVAQVMFDSFFATPWTVACQAPLSMRFSRQEYWSGLPFPSPGDLPDPGIKPGHCRQILYCLSHQGSRYGPERLAQFRGSLVCSDLFSRDRKKGLEKISL